MFTGIVTDIGVVRTVEGKEDKRLVLATHYEVGGIDIGASIACSGACLTVTARGTDETGGWFGVDASAETLRCTTLGSWAPGTRVNLERALRIGEELGGHIVTGHVDGLARLTGVEPVGSSLKMILEAPADLAPFIAPKGSISLDGVSLTVNEVAGRSFTVNIIPLTRRVTTLGDRVAGDAVNVEVDLMARYIARLSTKA